MFYIVTLSLRSVSTIRSTTGRRSSIDTQSIPRRGPTPLQHKVTDVLVYGLLCGLSKPLPDHITLPPRTDILPSRVLLYYSDKDQAHAVIKDKSINDKFCIDGKYRRIIADVAYTAETELRAFVQAAGVVKNADKLRKDDLAAALLFGDCRKVAAERTKFQALHTRLEGKMEKLQEDAGELEFLSMKLLEANAKVDRLTARLKKQGRGSVGQAGTATHKHRYPTRYSLTPSSASLEDESFDS